MGNGWGTGHRCELCLRRFRKIVGQNGENGGPYQFCGLWGYRNDQDAGLIHVGARYYESETGKWVQKDSLLGDAFTPQSLNRYGYCEINPVNAIDPTGTKTWGDVFRGIGWAILAGGLVVIGGLVIIGTGGMVGIGGVIVGGIAGAVGGAAYYGYSTPYEEWDNFALAESIVSGSMINAGLATIGLVAYKLPKLAFIAIEALEECRHYMPSLP